MCSGAFWALFLLLDMNLLHHPEGAVVLLGTSVAGCRDYCAGEEIGICDDVGGRNVGRSVV